VEKLRAEVDALEPAECERACRQRGLVADGGAQACAKRLLDLTTYIRGEAASRSTAVHNAEVDTVSSLIGY
jgi:hypothetical protein